MSDIKSEWVEAGARALADATGTGAPWADETWGDEAAAVIAAVAPLIRADERLADLRAQVEALPVFVTDMYNGTGPHYYEHTVLLADVLALLGGDS